MLTLKLKGVPIRKLLILSITGIIVLMLSDIPYVNLLITTQLLLFIIWFLAFIVFNFNSKITIFSFFTVLLYSLILFLVNRENEAQDWGTYSFPILVLGLVKFFLEQRKEIT